MRSVAVRIGGGNHAAERVAGKVGLLDPELTAQRLQILDEILERVGWRALRGGAMASQVV